MNAVARSWVRKAERDFKVASGLLQRWAPGYGDAACFHCQQAVEKYLKARLMAAGIRFPRTHDLAALLALLLPIDPLWQSFDKACNTLTKYAVDVRYPGDDATKRDALQALKLATAIRREARLALGLKR
jgi:HEPN domain-containing protein